MDRPAGEEGVCGLAAASLPILLEPCANLILDDAAAAAEFTEAVEVAERGHVGIDGVGLVLGTAVLLPEPLGGGCEGKHRAQKDDLLAAALGGHAHVEPCGPLRRRHCHREEAVVAVGARRREDVRLHAFEKGADLRGGAANRRGTGDDLGADPPAAMRPRCQCIDRRLVDTGDRAQRPGDEVELVLDHEIGTGQARSAERRALAGIARAIEAVGIMAINQAEQRAGLAGPGERGELVHRGDEEAGEPAVDRLVHADDRQRVVASEVAGVVGAGDAEILRVAIVRYEANRIRREGGAAPGAFLDRDRCGMRAGVAFEPVGAGVRGLVAAGPRVAAAAHAVGRGGAANPEADLERPGAELRSVALSLEFESADQGCGTAQLVEREQAERVAHEHGKAAAERCAVHEPAEHDRVGSEAEVGLRLAAAGGEEEKVYAFAVAVALVSETVERKQDECQLEWPPCRGGHIGGRAVAALRKPLAAAGGRRHRAVGDPKRLEGLGIRGEHRDAGLDALRGRLHVGEHVRRGLATAALHVAEHGSLGIDPGAVLLYQRQDRCGGGGTIGESAELLHAERHALQYAGFDPLDLGVGNPDCLD